MVNRLGREKSLGHCVHGKNQMDRPTIHPSNRHPPHTTEDRRRSSLSPLKILLGSSPPSRSIAHIAYSESASPPSHNLTAPFNDVRVAFILVVLPPAAPMATQSGLSSPDQRQLIGVHCSPSKDGLWVDTNGGPSGQMASSGHIVFPTTCQCWFRDSPVGQNTTRGGTYPSSTAPLHSAPPMW